MSARPTLVSAFPGTGKSWFFKKTGTSGACSDSDSSMFDKEGFPENYLRHIEGLYSSTNTGLSYVFISTHEQVRTGLVACKLPFVLVYPHHTLRDEYLDRYRSRGGPESMVKLMTTEWDNFIGSCQRQHGCKHVVLTAGQYLADVLPKP
jgi:hypothetical protein